MNKEKLPDVLDADGEDWYFDFVHPLSNIYKLACRDYSYEPWEIMDIAESVAAQFNTKYGNDARRKWSEFVSKTTTCIVTYEEALITSTRRMKNLAASYAKAMLDGSKGVYAKNEACTSTLAGLISSLSWLYLRGEDIHALTSKWQKDFDKSIDSASLQE